MAKKTRHEHKVELRRNDLLEYGNELKEFAARNILTLVLAVGVVVCGFVIVSMMTAKRKATAAQVWETYLLSRGSRTGNLQLAEEFHKQYPSEPLALVALGDAKLADLTAKRAEVSDADQKARLDEAYGLFEQAERRAGDRYAKAQAQLGLGAVEEYRAAMTTDPAVWDEKLKAAGAQYENVIKGDASDAAAIEAKRRQARLAEYPSPRKVSDPNLQVGSALKPPPPPPFIPPVSEVTPAPIPPVPETKNETPKPETKAEPKSEAPKAEPKTPDVKAESPKSDAPKADAKTPTAKAESPKPESPKAEAPKPEVKKQP